MEPGKETERLVKIVYRHGAENDHSVLWLQLGK